MRKTVTAMLAGVALGAMLPMVVSQSTAQNAPAAENARTTYEYLDLFGEIFERVAAGARGERGIDPVRPRWGLGTWGHGGQCLCGL